MTAQQLTDIERLYSSARKLVPALKERQREAASLGHLPEATVREMQEAGFFPIMQPARYGGLEMDPEVFFRVQMALAEGCMSTAWVLGVVTIHNWQLALFDDRAQQDVWGEDTSVLISSAYMPVGKVTRVDGGYRLSGHWGFSSGSKHCQWAFLGAMVPPEKPGDAPDYRTFLVPRSDYQIVDNWDVSGLEGTDSYVEVNRNRVGLNDGNKIASDPDAQMALANAIATVDECEAINAMFIACGAQGIHRGHPLNRAWLDINAGRTHVANNPFKFGRNLGGTLMGQPNADFFL